MNSLEEKKSTVEVLSAEEILIEIKSLKANENANVIQIYLEALIKKEANLGVVTVEFVSTLNECIYQTLQFAREPLDQNLGKKLVHQEILILLYLMKCKALKREEPEFQDVILNLVNQSCDYTNICNKQNMHKKIYYYSGKVLSELESFLKTSSKDEVLFEYKLLQNKKVLLTLNRMESLYKDNNLEEALHEVRNIKALILHFNSHFPRFTCICYNFAVKCASCDHYEWSIFALEAVKDVYNASSISSFKIGFVFLFLAYSYSKTSPEINWNQVIKTLELQRKFDDSVTFDHYIMKFEAALHLNDKHVLEDVLNEFLGWENATMTDVLSIIKMLIERSSDLDIFEYMKKIKEKKNSIDDKLHLMKFELHLHFSHNNIRQADYLIKEVINIVKEHHCLSRAIRGICKIILHYASIKLHERMFSECLKWYEYCTQLLKYAAPEDLLYTYAMKRLCLCHIELRNTESAKRIFSGIDWKNIETDNLSVYCSLQLSVLCEDSELSETTLKNLGHVTTDVGKVLLACCKTALESGKKTFLLNLLETSLRLENVADNGLLMMSILQCLLRLHFEHLGEKEPDEKFQLYLDKALQFLQKEEEDEETMGLCEWFSRVAWNLALKTQNDDSLKFDFFLRCCCFLEKTSDQPRLKNSLMMTAASGLKAVRNFQMMKRDDSQVEVILSKVLTVVEKCKNLEQGRNVTLLRLLQLYQFEATLRMKNNAHDCNMKEILQLPFLDIKTLEHFAAIAYECNPLNYKIISQTLKAALEKITASPYADGIQASKIFHSLFQNYFNTQEYVAPSPEEENMKLCEKLWEFLENDSLVNYPQLEILWIMTKCWNWGIKVLSRGHGKRAYKWCSLAMSFLTKLTSLRSLHETKLQRLYSAYFSNFENEKDV